MGAECINYTQPVVPSNHSNSIALNAYMRVLNMKHGLVKFEFRVKKIYSDSKLAAALLVKDFHITYLHFYFIIKN